MSDDSRRNSSEEASKSAAVEDPPKDQGVAPTAASAERPGVLEDIFTEIARLVELTPRKYRKVANREGLVMLTAATMHMEDLIVNNHHLRAESRTTDLQIQALQRRVQYLVQQNAHLVGTIEGLGFSYEEENRDSDLAPFWYGFLPGLDRPDVGDESSRWNDATYRGGQLRRTTRQPDLTDQLTGQSVAQNGAESGSSKQQPRLTQRELLDLLDGGETDSEAGDDAEAAPGEKENGNEN